MKGWKRRPDARAVELARAALELCAVRGVQATRVADVAARAGVTVGTVYRYFRSKDELIDAALRTPARPRVRAALVARPGSALPQLAEAIRRWSAFFHAEGARAVRVALSDPRRGLAGPVSAFGEAVREFEEIVADGATRGDVRSDIAASAAAHVIASAIAAAPILELRAGDAAVVESLVAIVTRGLRADGPSWRP